ncbi:Heterokaryon incompatibility protein s [Apiospora saccharicola]
MMTMDPSALCDVAKKASGVFLWAIVACRSLIQGFEAFDYLNELRNRANEPPTMLEDVFEHILTRIEPCYQWF